MTTTATPAVVRTSAVRDFLTELGLHDVPSHYTVCSAGVWNHDTGQLVECDTAAFYAATGAGVGEEITIGDGSLQISRYVVLHNDGRASTAP